MWSTEISDHTKHKFLAITMPGQITPLCDVLFTMEYAGSVPFGIGQYDSLHEDFAPCHDMHDGVGMRLQLHCRASAHRTGFHSDNNDGDFIRAFHIMCMLNFPPVTGIMGVRLCGLLSIVLWHRAKIS